MAAVSEKHTSRNEATWSSAAAGAAPVLILALATTMEGTSTQVFPSVLLVYGYILLLFILPVIGILRAVEQGFPDWSFPYLGLVVLDALLLLSIMTARLFENALGMLLLRGALVALLLYFIYGLLTRLRGVAQNWSAVGHDWTQFLLSVHVLMPLLVMVVFDEIAVTYKTPYILLCGCILAAGAVVYLRSRSRWLGAGLLVASAVLAWLLAGRIADLYWSVYTGLLG